MLKVGQLERPTSKPSKLFLRPTDRPTDQDNTLVNDVIGGKMVSASVDCCIELEGRLTRTKSILRDGGGHESSVAKMIQVGGWHESSIVQYEGRW